MELAIQNESILRYLSMSFSFNYIFCKTLWDGIVLRAIYMIEIAYDISFSS